MAEHTRWLPDPLPAVGRTHAVVVSIAAMAGGAYALHGWIAEHVIRTVSVVTVVATATLCVAAIYAIAFAFAMMRHFKIKQGEAESELAGRENNVAGVEAIIKRWNVEKQADEFLAGRVKCSVADHLLTVWHLEKRACLTLKFINDSVNDVIISALRIEEMMVGPGERVHSIPLPVQNGELKVPRGQSEPTGVECSFALPAGVAFGNRIPTLKVAWTMTAYRVVASSGEREFPKVEVRHERPEKPAP